jgi:hypothetical protein
MAAKWV